MKFRTIFILAFAIACSSVGQGKKLEGLIVKGDYKKLPLGIIIHGEVYTKEEIQTAVKLRLLANNISPQKIHPPSSQHWLGIQVLAYENGGSVEVGLYKVTEYYTESQRYIGPSFKPNQDTYGGIMTDISDKKVFIDFLNKILDNFIVDYLEANVADRREKKIKIPLDWINSSTSSP